MWVIGFSEVGLLFVDGVLCFVGYVFCFDVKKCGEPFYFENIIHYIKRCLDGIKDISFDENWKRQIIINANMVILSAELNIIRINECVSKEKREELIKLIDSISIEYTELWDRENYPKRQRTFSFAACREKTRADRYRK